MAGFNLHSVGFIGLLGSAAPGGTVLPGYTGLIAPGYAPPGDARVLEYVDDARVDLWTYSPGWLTDTNAGDYYAGTIHYRDDYGTAAVSYYGGGFTVVSHTAPSFCDADIYVNNTYEGTVSYYSASVLVASDLLAVPLPEGLHTVEFRQKPAGGRVRLVHDAIRLFAKPA
ncbi:hypothetical protein ACVWYF_004139 [Hymenobacter sp. UYAg731]